MNLFCHNNLQLVPRNEGKIKSYASCTDIRAWSHDVRVQDRYLREWMKADTPVCIIQTSSLIKFLRTMTCKSRRRATPRCHPDCKSKLLLESICNSCRAVRECLQRDRYCEKYFIEEELESSHWPCDTCLDALKSIKMFWKILSDKLFNINLSKFKTCQSRSETMLNGVSSLTKVWQSEIQQQALFVRDMTSTLNRGSNTLEINKSATTKFLSQKSAKLCSYAGCRSKHSDDCKRIPSSKRHLPKTRDSREYSTVSKNTSITIRMNDVGCDTSCFAEVIHEDLQAAKKKIEGLQAKCHLQAEEIERLRKENNALKKELECGYKSCPLKASFYIPDDKENNRTGNVCPITYAPSVKECCPAKRIDSEMIITMKNGKDESFKHVSVLKVLHKTNDPRNLQTGNDNNTCSKKEDPIEILSKVQTTFGAIVRREMCIVKDRRERPKMTEVDAAFYKVNSCKSQPSCSTSSSSGSAFLSSQDFMDKNCFGMSYMI